MSLIRWVHAIFNLPRTGNSKSVAVTNTLWPATAAVCQFPVGLVWFMLRSVCAAMSSQLLLLLTIVWLGRHSELRKKMSSLARSLFLLTLPEPYHLLSRLFLALILASISSKEITSKIILVLVSSYFIPNTQCIPSTITTPITFLMAVLRIWCDTCEGRAEEASSSCSNGSQKFERASFLAGVFKTVIC